ncbi:hypothetical protein [Pedobacter sp. ASV28]|uniref:hypothetical protein n=1 Tax=Pedobacter sp. ASV28 TaxID=2795123 RepID=UPI001E58734E|nr:hypothetical protein [Pedobacter sp. ASV28]
MPHDIISGYIVPLSILLPIGMFIFRYRHANMESKLLFYYLIVAGLINLTAIGLVKFRMSNLPLLHIYTIVETTFFMAYFRLIFESKKIKRFLTVVMIGFPILCILNFLFIQDLFTYNTYTRPLEAVIITFVCLLYFYKSGFTENWLNNPINWLNMGIMIYFPAASIIFILSNYFVFVLHNYKMANVIWDVHSILVLLMYLLWAKGFSLIRKSAIGK